MVEKPSGESGGESGGQEKSLEMRVAELEDKLAQMHITEEEAKAYQKVSGLLGAAAVCSWGTRAAAVPPCVEAAPAPPTCYPAAPCGLSPCAASAAPPCVAAQAATPCVASQGIRPQPIYQPIRPITNWQQPIIRPIWRPIITEPCWAECIAPGGPGTIPGGFDVPGQDFGQLGG